MSKTDKRKNRLKQYPTDFTYKELKSLLTSIGYEEYNKGKTSGSRVIFIRKKDNDRILIHKPHPSDILKEYTIKDVVNHLKENGEL